MSKNSLNSQLVELLELEEKYLRYQNKAFAEDSDKKAKKFWRKFETLSVKSSKLEREFCEKLEETKYFLFERDGELFAADCRGRCIVFNKLEDVRP